MDTIFDKISRFAGAALVLMLLTSLPAFSGDELPKVASGEIAPADAQFDGPLAMGISLVYQDRYQEGLALFDSLQKEFPDHPAPYFYRAAIYQGWMSSYRFNTMSEKLETDIQTAIDKGNALLDENKDDPWLNFYVGASYGYRGFYRFRKFNWIGAYMDGRKGVGNFEKALDKDPTLYDVYLGLGSYHYWRTAKSKFIKVVAFWMRDKRDLGLKQIQFAIDHGRYSKPEATIGLVIALYDYERYDEALQLLETFLEPPQVQIVSAIYLRGRLMAKLNRWDEVERDFREVLSRLDDAPYRSVGYEVECKYWIAEALAQKGDTDAARELANEAYTLSRNRVKDKELEGPLDGFDDNMDRLKDLRKKLNKS